MKRVVLRLATLIVVTLVAGGAGPGAVGSCSDTSKAIDWNQFCQAKYWAFCLKWEDEVSRAPDTANPALGVCESTDRQGQIERVCAGTPIPCNGPTDLQGEACVEAIYRRNQVSYPGDMTHGVDLPSECLLCGGS